jgi:hypothetical protein
VYVLKYIQQHARHDCFKTKKKVGITSSLKNEAPKCVNSTELHLKYMKQHGHIMDLFHLDRRYWSYNGPLLWQLLVEIVYKGLVLKSVFYPALRSLIRCFLIVKVRFFKSQI